ncbi:MAG: DUF5615 family PIN-like protein [bacterium]
MMKFIVDECTGPAVAAWLRSKNYEVFSVFDQSRGMDDAHIIQKARAEGWVLITTSSWCDPASA